MIPVVDQQAFDSIECNRCGECCEGFFLELSTGNSLKNMGGPIGMIEYREYWRAHGMPAFEMTYDTDLTKSMFWFGSLEPWQDDEGRWRYRCPHFSRDNDGLGVCGIYEDRPRVCSDFPYGKPQTFWDKCSWNVEILDYEVVQ
jgi:Fe-S-cluster containining protein